MVKGFKRIIDNPDLSVSDLNSIISWINNLAVQLSLKIQLKEKYIELKSEIASLLNNFNYYRIVNQYIYHIGDFFKIIHNEYCNDIKIKNEFVEKLIEVHKNNNDYWYLVFRVIPLLDDDFIFQKITRDWLNKFFIELRSEINSLGKELYGEVYPEFKELEEYENLKNKSVKKENLLK